MEFTRVPGDGLSVNLSYSSGTVQLNENELLKKMVFATDESADLEEHHLPLKLLFGIMNRVIFCHPTADLPIFIDDSNKSPTTSNLPNANIAVLQGDWVELPTSLTSAISRQICRGCSTSGGNAHSTVKNILLLTKKFRWDAKVVLILASFAAIFGEFRLAVRLLHTNSPLGKAAALLKKDAERLDNADDLVKQKLELLFALITEILDVTEKIVDFYEIRQNDYLTTTAADGCPAQDLAVIVYWTSRSIVVCATEILALRGKGRGMGINFKVDITSLTSNLNNKKRHLLWLIESYKSFLGVDIACTFGSSDVDNSKSLELLFDMPGLYDCYRRKQISYENLKSKVVVLFLTDLDPDLTTRVEYAILQQLYLEKWHNQSRVESMYELVWIPLLRHGNWTGDEFELFKNLRKKMEWHSVDDPSKVDWEIIKFAKEKWNFLHKDLQVKVMDIQGKIVHENAIYMMCTWGSLAYPFTAARERRLWEETTWSINLLVDDIEQNMRAWIQEGKHICVYGGEDVAWIREFTNIAKRVASETAISMELLYVGRSKLKKELTTIINVIQKEGLSRTLDWNLIWYFWVRLENIWNSKKQTVNNDNIENDPIIQGVYELLSYDIERQNWAMITSGQGEKTIMADGSQMCKALHKLQKKQLKSTISFVPDLNDYIRKTFPVFSNWRPITIDKSGKDIEPLEAIGHVLESTHMDNSRSLHVLFHYRSGEEAFYDCSNKKTISSDDFRKKIVMLLITDLDPELRRRPELDILRKTYLEQAYSQYEVVWVPIVDSWSEENYQLFETLRDQMEWHSVHQPYMVSSTVIRFIKEKWNFTEKPLLVVMDTQGTIVHQNALHMMCIWGNLAAPFTTNRERSLWSTLSWSLELLADNLEPSMELWDLEEKYICLYGGQDMEWIRKFTSITKDVARESGFGLEFLYVGKNNAKERVVGGIIEAIQKENLSRTLDMRSIRHFWMRLESMWHSRGQLINPENVNNDPIMQGIIATLSYGSSGEGWALFSRGFKEMVKANGEYMLKSLAEHGWWKPREAEIGFVPALDEYLQKIHLEAPQHLNRLLLSEAKDIPATVVCAECGRPMEMFLMFSCCRD